MKPLTKYVFQTCYLGNDNLAFHLTRTKIPSYKLDPFKISLTVILIKTLSHFMCQLYNTFHELIVDNLIFLSTISVYKHPHLNNILKNLVC